MQTKLLALMPCPLKIPFEQRISMLVQELKQHGDFALDYQIVSNATQQLNFFEELARCEKEEDLPDLMIAPGFNGFFYKQFVTRFVEKGIFSAVDMYSVNDGLQASGIQDERHHYTIPCFNPTVLVVDRTLHKDLPVPQGWADLMQPEYTGLVAMRGHSDEDFCEGILLNIYKEHGLAGVEQLGKSVKMGLHPAEMVNYIGSGKAEAPAISAMPYSFARLVEQKKHVTLVWPADGAIVNPLVMLVKRDSIPQLRQIAGFIAGQEMGRIFADAFFPSIHPEVANQIPEGASLKWLGWDFIMQNDLEPLKLELNRIFVNAFQEECQ